MNSRYLILLGCNFSYLVVLCGYSWLCVPGPLLERLRGLIWCWGWNLFNSMLDKCLNPCTITLVPFYSSTIQGALYTKVIFSYFILESHTKRSSGAMSSDAQGDSVWFWRFKPGSQLQLHVNQVP